MYALHPAFFCPQAKNVLGRFVPSALPHYEKAFFWPQVSGINLKEKHGLIYTMQEIARYARRAAAA